jgi:hypothetical protein
MAAAGKRQQWGKVKVRQRLTTTDLEVRVKFLCVTIACSIMSHLAVTLLLQCQMV